MTILLRPLRVLFYLACWLVGLAIALAIGLGHEGAAGGQQRIIDGVAYVRDGDTIVVGSTPVRLNGLACPELDEPGGFAARALMVRIINGQRVTCTLNGDQTRDREVGICYIAGADVATVMISAGLCRDCPRFSGGRYAEIENGQSKQQPFPSYCHRQP